VTLYLTLFGADGRQSAAGGPTRGACVLRVIDGFQQSQPADERVPPLGQTADVGPIGDSLFCDCHARAGAIYSV